MSGPAPVHIYQTYIRASADQVWTAITDPDFTRRYFHRTAFESALEPGSPYRMVLPDGSDAVVGTIEEVERPTRLVMTWRILYDAAAADEPPSRVEWLLTENEEGVTKVTTIHRDLALSPITSASVGDGWVWVLQSMKTLIETGEALPGTEPSAEDDRSSSVRFGRGGRGGTTPPPRHHGEQLDVGVARWARAVGGRDRRHPRPRIRLDVSLATGGPPRSGERGAWLVARESRARRARSRRPRPASCRAVQAGGRGSRAR